MTKKKEIVIELRDVWKTYVMGENKIHALSGMNLKVYKGEFLAIVGKSGSGKTTAVNMIGSLDTPTKGKIILDNYDTSKLTESQIAIVRGRNIGYIFQKFNLINTLSAQENVELPMIFQGIPKNVRNERAKRLLCDLEMGDRLINKPSELSGGQQQRVAIARALSNQPDIILADEPTGNLDSKTGVMVMKCIKNLNKQGKTIILVTHDEKLSHFAHRIVTLVDGKVVDEKINRKIL